MPDTKWLGAAQIKAEGKRKERDRLATLLADAQALADKQSGENAALLQVGEAVRALAIQCQTSCKASIENLVTRCLEAVFPENKYRFNLVFERKRDQSEARCTLTDALGNEYDPLKANGGGVLDVISFALRLATIALRVPQPAKVLILDEPFRCISREHTGRVAALLEALAEEYGFQFIMVTHNRELARGNVIEL